MLHLQRYWAQPAVILDTLIPGLNVISIFHGKCCKNIGEKIVDLKGISEGLVCTLVSCLLALLLILVFYQYPNIRKEQEVLGY